MSALQPVDWIVPAGEPEPVPVWETLPDLPPDEAEPEPGEPPEPIDLTMAAPVAAVIRYEIRDAAGELVAVHCRQDRPGGKWLWWQQPNGRRGLGGLPLADLPLFGIEKLDGRSTVVIAEGEKAALALIDAGVPAVGTVTGAAATPGRAALADLTGRSVVLWPDADDVGGKHMGRIAAGLVGIAADVRWIEWSEAPEHGDAADYLARGLDPADLIDSAGPFRTLSAGEPTEAGPRIVFESIATATCPPLADAWHVEGLWRPGTLNVLAAFEGVGKSQVRGQAGMLLAKGSGSLFGRYPIRQQCTVAVLDEENGAAEEWRREESLLAYLGLSRADVAAYHRASFAGVVLGDAAWQTALVTAVEQLAVPGLPVVLFLDTATAMVDGKEYGEDLKPIIRFLRRLLTSHDFLTIVLVVHVRKPTGDQRELDAELASVMGNWSRLCDTVAIMAPLTDGRARFRVHKKAPPSDVILAREDGGWRFLADYTGSAKGGIDPLELLELARSRGSLTAAQVMAEYGVSKHTALDAMREHPDLDVAPTGRRGTLIAFPKGGPVA